MQGWEPDEFVEKMKKRGIRVPGIGHRIKSKDNRDKRVELLQRWGVGLGVVWVLGMACRPRSAEAHGLQVGQVLRWRGGAWAEIIACLSPSGPSHSGPAT